MFCSRSFLISLALFCTFTGGAAHAVQRTHVSAGFGADANTASNCSATAPCRFFQAAMTVTDINGEVIVLDSGGYGAVTITQSISLIAPTGVYAGISVFPGATGVTIGTPGVNVVLRGLTINGQGGDTGISMTAGNKLTVENCVIANLTGTGVYVSGATDVQVTDTTIRGNAAYGLYVENGVRATVTRATVSGNTSSLGYTSGAITAYGTAAGTTTTVDVADSTVDGSKLVGIYAYTQNVTATVGVSVTNSRIVRNAEGVTSITAGGTVKLSVSNNIISHNTIGIGGYTSGSRVWASGNTVSNNGVGFVNSGGLFESAGNNAVRNNNTNSSAGITTIAPL